MNNRELYDHKRSDTIKWIVAFALIVVLLAGMIGAWVVLFQENPAEDVPVEDELPVVEGEDLPVIDNEGNELSSEMANAMPMGMTFRTAASLAAAPAAQSETYDSVKLTATVKPDSAADKSVDWAVVFVNPSSEWASGKTVTDYVTVTPSSDGSTTATVKCLQPFGEQVKITVTSRMNKEATASCTVDFAARPVKFLVGGFRIFGKVTPFFTAPADKVLTIEPMVASSANLDDYTTNTTPTLSCIETTAHTTGSVEIKDFRVEEKASAGFYQALKNLSIAAPTNDYTDAFIEPIPGTIVCSMALQYIWLTGSEEEDPDSIDHINRINTALMNCSSNEYDIEFRVTVETNIGTYVHSVKTKVNRSSSVFGVENIQLSNSNIVI